MLEEQCKSWMGITSVAVYWPLIYFQSNNTENLEGAKVTVQAFHAKMEQQGKMAASPRGQTTSSCSHSFFLCLMPP